MFLFKIVILFFLSLNIFASDNYIDSLTLTKVKKLIEKEEEIATAYKKYILEKGSEPSTLETLKTTTGYLPSNFSTNNYFGGTISFSTNANKLRSISTSTSITSNNDLKSNIYDYYYSNKYRTNTKAPLSTNNNDVEIVLSTKEKFIYTNKSKITTTKADAVAAGATGKYYLDTNGVLHWYQSGVYKFSVDKDLIVDSSVTMLNADKTVKTDFKEMIKDVTYAGQTILQNNTNTGSADAYTGIDGATIVRQNPDILLDTQLGLMQIGKNSGGMIVNGDIYTWGNNANRITGINIDKYTKDSGATGTQTPVINTLVRVKAKMYDVNKYIQETNNSTNRADCKSPIGTGTLSCKYSTTTDCIDPTGSGTILCKDIGSEYYAQNYFSSPLRPRFVDLFSNTNNGTCGISTIGELYCGGIVSSLDKSFGNLFTQVDTVRNGEMLYRSTYFDGTTDSKKASKIFANNQLWLILSKDGDIYRWGTEDSSKNGFSGNGSAGFNIDTTITTSTTKTVCVLIIFCHDETTTSTTTVSKDTNKIPEKITENVTTTKFKDISNTLAIGYRKMFALSTTGELYLWGMDTNIATMPTCGVTWEGVAFNLCQATRVTALNSNLPTGLTFISMRSGLKAIIALGSDGKYYKIEQPKSKKVQITEIKDGTTTLLGTTALSVDLTSDGTVVYVNASNQLISSYFNTASFDSTFRTTIGSMLWKSIKVLEDTNNSMCGINTDNQMYCWGVIQTDYNSTNYLDNTFMLPIFNTNLYDSKLDYLVSEGGTSSVSLTAMTTNATWLSSSKFNIKYPTYIGGFNYEVIFK